MFVNRYSFRAGSTALIVLIMCAMLGLSACAGHHDLQADVLRHCAFGSNFPITAAIEVPPGINVIYFSGQVLPLVDKSKSLTDPLAFGGDTQAQTEGVLRSIDAQLKILGLGIKDTIKMQVFLVAASAKGNEMKCRFYSRIHPVLRHCCPAAVACTLDFSGSSAGQPSLAR